MFDHYASAVHALGADLSMSQLLTPVSPALAALAQAGTDPSRQRADEPYRRALTGVYARLLATTAHLGLVLHARPAIAAAPPYVTADEFRSDLAVVADSLARHGSERIARLRIVPLLRTIDVFGFHGATLDLRQSSDMIESVVAELLTTAEVCSDYRRLDEKERIRLLSRDSLTRGRWSRLTSTHRPDTGGTGHVRCRKVLARCLRSARHRTSHRLAHRNPVRSA